MKKLLATILFIVTVFALPSTALADISPANFWKQVGSYLQPWKSTLGVQAPSLNITGTATTTRLCFGVGNCQTTAYTGGVSSSWATTSTDYWKTQRDLFSTTSANYLLGTKDKGYFFSTTSADYWFTTQPSGSQTPWTSEIDADSNNLVKVGQIGIATDTPISAITLNGDGANTGGIAFGSGDGDYGYIFNGGSELDISSSGDIEFYYDLDGDNEFEYGSWTRPNPEGAVDGLLTINTGIESTVGTSTFVNGYFSGDLQVDGIFYAPVAVTVSGDLDMGTHDITNADTIGVSTINGDTINIDHIATNLAEYLEIGAGSAPLYLNGNVGIGTTTPSSALDIWAGNLGFWSGDADDVFYVGNSGGELNFSNPDGTSLILLSDTSLEFGADGGFTGTIGVGGVNSTGLSFTTDGTAIDFNSPITVSGSSASEFQGDLTVVGTTTSGALELTTAGSGIKFQDGTYLTTAPVAGGASEWNFGTNFATTMLKPTTTMPVWVQGALYASSSIYWTGGNTEGTNIYRDNSLFLHTYGGGSHPVTGNARNNLSIGYNAGQNLPAYSAGYPRAGNTLIGYLAGNAMTASGGSAMENNTIIGSEARRYGASGSGNTVIGAYSGWNLTNNVGLTGSGNVIIGNRSGQKIADGNYNVVIGDQVQSGGVSSASDSVIINGTVSAGTQKYYNVVIGNSSLAIEGERVVSLGKGASATGNSSTVLGAESTVSATKGTALGSYATAVTNSVAIGYHADATVANTMILGEAGDTANSLNVGIGTTTPIGKLSVFTTGTTTLSVDSNSATKGACLVLKDSDGVGYTYITANDGVLSASTESCR